MPETAGRPAATAAAAESVRRPGLHTALTDRTFLVFVGLTFVLAVAHHADARRSCRWPCARTASRPSAYGLVVALGGALIVVGQLFVPRLIDRRRKDVVLAAATALLALGFGALRRRRRLPVYLGAAVVWTVGSMLAAPPNAQINADLAPPQLRARYQAVFYLTFPAAAFVAPTLGGVSLQHLGDRHWLLVGAMGLVAALGHLAAGPARDREVARRVASAPRGRARSRRASLVVCPPWWLVSAQSLCSAPTKATPTRRLAVALLCTRGATPRPVRRSPPPSARHPQRVRASAPPHRLPANRSAPGGRTTSQPSPQRVQSKTRAVAPTGCRARKPEPSPQKKGPTGAEQGPRAVAPTGCRARALRPPPEETSSGATAGAVVRYATTSAQQAPAKTPGTDAHVP